MMINIIQELIIKLGNLVNQKKLAPIPLKSAEKSFKRVRRY